MKAHIVPTINPTITCARVCCRSIIRLVPTTPPIITTTDSHHDGLKMKMCEKAIIAPATPPIAAECVEIFQWMFIMAHTICMNSAAIRIVPMKCGMCMRFMK